MLQTARFCFLYKLLAPVSSTDVTYMAPSQAVIIWLRLLMLSITLMSGNCFVYRTVLTIH
jgi:hypothetical protein